MEIKCIEFGSMGANCYLLETEDVKIVIDPFKLDGRIEAFLSSDKPKYVFLTHCHFDHILGAEAIRKKFGAKIAIGEHDAVGLSDTYFSLSEMAGFNQAPFYADITFKNGQVFKEGNTRIQVLHTPGHTAGSVCYLLEDCIFTGDTLFEGTIGRTDFPTGDFSVMKKSLEKLKSLGKDYIIYSGHGPKTTLFREKTTNPYLI
ncbi:MAG: MBL fold metallo-hydrolase [Clostridia bacterium]|nr:MBL fold metallo-hydrolase [Clostridia bacterium]